MKKKRHRKTRGPIILGLTTLTLFTVPEKEELYLTLNTYEQNPIARNVFLVLIDIGYQ